MAERDGADGALDHLTVDKLRTLLRGLSYWRSTYETLGERVQCITDDDGFEWSIIDVEHIYAASQRVLPPRQAQAIRFFLVGNERERDVAIRMGINPTNPIGMYATDGLRRLVEMIQSRELWD